MLFKISKLDDLHLPRKLWSLTDWFLGAHFPDISSDQLLRSRMLVCSTLVLSVSHLSLFFMFMIGDANTHLIIADLILALSLWLSPFLLKWTKSLRVASIYFCSLLLSTITYVSLHEDGFYWLASPWMVVIPLSVMFLLGARAGIITTLFVVMLSLIVVYCHKIGYAIPGMLVPTQGSIAWIIVNVGAIGLLAIVGAIHTFSREIILKELARSEAKLSTLMHSSSDLICSLDHNLCLTTLNTALVEFLRAQNGPEPRLGMNFFELVPAERQADWQQRLKRVLQGDELTFEERYNGGNGTSYLDLVLCPIRSARGVIGITCNARDVTQRKINDLRLQQTHAQLVTVSRQAGMSEVASGILHNVGNVLNSVNISLDLIQDTFQALGVDGLVKSAAVLRAHADHLDIYLSKDPKGRLLPMFLIKLAEHQTRQRDVIMNEAQLLSRNIEHIKRIISAQQSLVKSSQLLEVASVSETVDTAVEISSVVQDMDHLQLIRDYSDIAPLLIDRHKIMQILINLLNNAHHALQSSARVDKKITIRIAKSEESMLLIEVMDNGIGIPAEIKDRLFEHGFTTKPDGHGFGLHTCANVAHEMSGTLSCHSDGPGYGALFSLELPLREAKEV